MTISTATMASLYRQLLQNLLATGWIASPHGRSTLEIPGLTLYLADSSRNVLVHPVRNLNYRFMIAEWLWVALGRNRLADLTRYNSKMAAFSDDGVTLAGAYGPRLRPQLPYLYRALADPDSRQAVATIWTPAPAASKDLPCTLALQFLLRRGRLHLIVTMRSSDAWLGIPYDFFTMSMLQNSLAGTLGVARGFIQFNLGSSHLYKEDAERAAGLVYTQPGGDETLRSPALDGPPPATMEMIFDQNEGMYGLTKEWLLYRRCLLTKTSNECLEVLREASELG
jgi:thymidylate synthase